METPNWPRQPTPNDPSSRSGPADDAVYQGFHTYATSDLYDTNGGNDRWPDNWSGDPQPEYADLIEDSVRDDDDDDAEYEDAIKRDYRSVLLWTMGWYAIPMIILILRAVFQPDTVSTACTAAGLGDCSSPRDDALATLISNAPIWCFALVGALTLAIVLRWASDKWRAATIGFCAAVVSGGAITILDKIL